MARLWGWESRFVASRLVRVAPHHAGAQLSAWVQGASQGDQASWDALVERFSGLIWSVARGFGMNRADAAEISQTTWLRLAEHLHHIEQPERLAAWLVTTTRRECLRQRRLHGRHIPLDDTHPEPTTTTLPAIDTNLLTQERDATLWRCIQALPERSRTLLTMLLTDPPIPYTQIAATLEMPIGSIGPTRSRLLATLRHHIEAAGITAAD
jgi:RNA polymerase sigma factor (sigma-70 family)